MSSTNTLPARHDPKPGKKRHLSLHLNLPIFRRSRGERPEADADEIARVRKAAAWQWYTRGVADAVVPTKRVPAAAAASSTANNDEVNNKQRAKSRFKAEASASPSQGTAPAASPLYDEFELSGLNSYMAEFVQRLQKQQEEDASAADSGTTPEIKLNQKPSSGSTFPISSFQRPLSAIHKLFRKISGAMKSFRSTNRISANHGRCAVPGGDEEMYKYYHYVHNHDHHHHHHQFGSRREERRHSESSNFGHTLLWELAAVDEEVEPMNATPSRRRHSERFSTHSMRESFTHEEVIGGPSHHSERFSTHGKMQGRGQSVELPRR